MLVGTKKKKKKSPFLRSRRSLPGIKHRHSKISLQSCAGLSPSIDPSIDRSLAPCSTLRHPVRVSVRSAGLLFLRLAVVLVEVLWTVCVLGEARMSTAGAAMAPEAAAAGKRESKSNAGREKFLEVYRQLKKELLTDSELVEYTNESRAWMEEVSFSYLGSIGLSLSIRLSVGGWL